MTRLTKHFIYTALSISMLTVLTNCNSQNAEQQKIVDYPYNPVPFTFVKIEDEFWRPRIETNRTVTIPFAIKKNEETGRIDNFALASGKIEGRYKGRRFNDTDVYKVIEGAAYSLQTYPDPKLEAYLYVIIGSIASAQEEDGYLYPARTAHPEDPAPGAGPKRWSRLRGSHELYNAGHMYEAAVVYYQATGKRAFLDVAVKNADMLVRTFGPDKRRDVPGHQQIEIGLAKLYLVTGNQNYLDLAKFFLDERGRPHDGGLYPEDSPFALYNSREYMQDHIPVLEQDEAVGHAVRASYMYSGMADVATLTGNEGYIKAIDKLWTNVVSKKLYLTGGIGARHTSEAFGADYELPNESAYTETCAAIGNAFWNHRMFLLHGEAKYIDIMERIMYNGLISGVSLEGNRFFYQNPLASDGGYERSPWFEVACCPSNIVRFLPSVPGYIYAQKDNNLYVNLFIQSTASITLNKKTVQIQQKTRYPWEGNILITVNPEKKTRFDVLVRIPGWAQNQPVPSYLYKYKDPESSSIILEINGIPVEVETEKGYVRLSRKWKKGDTIMLNLPMPVRRVLSHPKVEDNQGRLALERGPLVYCLEGIDNGGSIKNLLLAEEDKFETEFRPDWLGGVTVIRGKAVNSVKDDEGNFLELEEREFIAIPYYAWANRGGWEMLVWIPLKPKGI